MFRVLGMYNFGFEYEDGSKMLDADADPNTAWTINNVIYHGSMRGY